MEEISLNILDIAENSIRAKATLIEISVWEDIAADYLKVKIKDNGCGMTKEQLTLVKDPFYTTRTTRQVGLGIPFFKMAAEISGGSFGINSIQGSGTEIWATFGLSHIDRMPLGDMASTVATLIQCNPEIDFIYTYTYNEAAFVLNTCELKVILDGVSLGEPQVAVFIKDFIKENVEQLALECLSE